jgi:hypothetical protein
MESERDHGLDYRVTTKLTLPADEAWLELEVIIHGKPADPWPEACWIALPFQISEPRFRIGRPGSVIDPAVDIVAGANRHLLAVNPGLEVLGTDGVGVGICPIDSPLVSLQEPGCWQYSRTFTPARSHVFVNLFNNQWTTNFRLWNGGTWWSRVRFWSIPGGNDLGSTLIRPAMEARVALAGVFVDGPSGPLRTQARGLEVDRPGVLVTAFGPNPDGAGTVLRLWEAAGTGGRCHVRLPAGRKVGRVRFCNLRGDLTGEAAGVDAGELTLDIPAFAPVSLVLEGIPGS